MAQNQVRHPGEILLEEIEQRGWSQSDLAWILGKPLQRINEIIKGKTSITARTAILIGAALGSGPDVWMRLQTSYDLSRAEVDIQAIEKRAKEKGKSK